MDVFADADRLPDSLIYAYREGVTPQEKHFQRVIDFHGNILNGGIHQAISNMREELELVPGSFSELGMHPVANIVKLAIQIGEDQFAGLRCQDIDAIYVSACYDLPYACNGNQDDPDFSGSVNGTDWVDRMALRYARANRQHFEAIVSAIE